MPNVATPPFFTEGPKINPGIGTLLALVDSLLNDPKNWCYRITGNVIGRATIRWQDSLGGDKWVDHIPFNAHAVVFYCQPNYLPIFFELNDRLLLQSEVVSIGIVQGTIILE